MRNPHGLNLRPGPRSEPRRAAQRVPRDKAGLRLDGPTLKQWTAAGYSAEHYPPRGYARRD